MCENISDRNEYPDIRYAKLRTTQIEAILTNERLTADEIKSYETELESLKPFLAEATKDTAKFQSVPKKRFRSQLRTESVLHPNQTVYGLTKDTECVITMDCATVNYLTNCGYSIEYETTYYPRQTSSQTI